MSSSLENNGIYTISREGGEPTLILDYVGIKGDFEWFNDGKELLLTLNKDQKPQLYRLDLATQTLQLVNLKHFWGSPNLSPNGDWVIFSGVSSEGEDINNSYRLRIYKSRLDDTNQRLTEMTDCEASSPQWIDFDAILANG